MFVGLRHHPRLFFASLFALSLTVFLAIFAAIGVAMLQKDVEGHAAGAISELEDFTLDILGTMKVLDAPPRAAACSEPFQSWLRDVAFRPDRINEIIYAPNGLVECSNNLGHISKPVALGLPDFVLNQSGKGDDETLAAYQIKVWRKIDLDALSLPNSVNWLMGYGDFVLVVPDLPLMTKVPHGIVFETVWHSTSNQFWHRDGMTGLYAGMLDFKDAATPQVNPGAGFAATLCDATSSGCVAVMEPLGPIFDRYFWLVIIAVVFSAVLASGVTYALKGPVERSWSLSSRVRRRLSAQTVACQYQPILDLKTNRISTVEVLVRWRDDDGSLVAPYAFLPIIEKCNLQRKLTRLVVNRAYRELSGLEEAPRPLHVHFNIFPSDFDPDWMIELFSDFLKDTSRFTVVIELVESDSLPIESTRAAIERLKKAGILTFIDDFGEGYSSIGYLAGLGTYGVKLDRSFGMAPEGSLMDAMMDSAIEMVAKTGQVLVVEGVETLWRLTSLRAHPDVALAQGYYISRPVDIAALDTLLGAAQFWPDSEAA